MSYADIRAECEELQIGPLLWELLVEVCERVSRRYPPDPYNYRELWTEESHRDLALETALERLLAERQLDYVLAIADDAPVGGQEDTLTRLLAFQVRRVLNHRRSVTVVDRLLVRIRALIGSEPFRTTEVGSDIGVSIAGGDNEADALTESDVHRGVQIIDSIPRLASLPSAKRESKVYKAADLQDLVERLVDAFGAVLLADIRRILEALLTAWLPTVLQDDEEDHASRATPELELERSQMNELITTLAQGLDPVQRLVLIGKSQGVPDGELADRVGRSRPWVADRKAEALDRVQQELIAELPTLLHDEAVRGLLDAVMVLEEADS
ncbi:MAG: hypothetical protein WD598_00985 [Acidimicrobiia bacterium]